MHAPSSTGAKGAPNTLKGPGRGESWAPERYRDSLQRLGFGALAVLLGLVIADEFERFLLGLSRTVPLALTFVGASMLAGWLVGSAIRAPRGDRFTLAAEFATRNVAIATAIAVTLLNRLEFAIFATTYFLAEVPLMLATVALFHASSSAHPKRS